MNKDSAIKTLAREARSKRKVSDAAVKRIMKACSALCCDNYETRMTLVWLGVCKDDGTPYNKKLKKVWW